MQITNTYLLEFLEHSKHKINISFITGGVVFLNDY